MRQSSLAVLLLLTIACPAFAAAPAGHDAIAHAIAEPTRGEANRARDRYRHPAETLGFFGVGPNQTIVEFIPGGGWYTEILAPLVKAKGRYIALTPVGAKPEAATAKMLADKKPLTDGATLATIDLDNGASTIPPGSADEVLTFRNVHNLIMKSDAAAPNAFAAFYRALKPGGVLGVVDHRLPEDRDTALEKKSGYIKRSTIVRLAEGAGFKLAGESAVNANPKDKADYPDGVWTLPPTLAKGDVDRDKYLAIGESDRMTLKFVKPKG